MPHVRPVEREQPPHLLLGQGGGGRDRGAVGHEVILPSPPARRGGVPRALLRHAPGEAPWVGSHARAGRERPAAGGARSLLHKLDIYRTRENDIAGQSVAGIRGRTLMSPACCLPDVHPALGVGPTLDVPKTALDAGAEQTPPTWGLPGPAERLHAKPGLRGGGE